MKRRTLWILTTTAFMLLSLPMAGYAQGGFYGRDQREYRRDRNYQNRFLKESVKRVDWMSGQLKRDLDRSLDRSRFDGRYREDRINDLASDFHSAASQLRNSFDSGWNPRGRFDDWRNSNHGAQAARRLLSLGSRLDAIIGRNRFSWQVESRWMQIKSDLRIIQNAYR
jgi:hypothetical protein